jgi:hypothetical protein
LSIGKLNKFFSPKIPKFVQFAYCNSAMGVLYYNHSRKGDKVSASVVQVGFMSSHGFDVIGLVGTPIQKITTF